MVDKANDNADSDMMKRMRKAAAEAMKAGKSPAEARDSLLEIKYRAAKTKPVEGD
jgi:hypothetical protein